MAVRLLFWIISINIIIKEKTFMKKIIALGLLLCLSVAVYACNNEHDISNDTHQFVDSNKNENNNNNNNNNIVTPSGGERPLLTIESIEEYTKILSTEKISNNFVRYEMISQIGKFDSLVFLSETAKDDFSSYMYNLVDATGYDISLYINEASNLPTVSTESITSIDTSDMRCLSGNKSGTYVNNCLTYRYVSGKLRSISWVDHGISYELCGSSTLSNYPSSNSTFVGKLMSKNDAVVAFNAVFNIEKND